jgi:hypothetical protein
MSFSSFSRSRFARFAPFFRFSPFVHHRRVVLPLGLVAFVAVAACGKSSVTSGVGSEPSGCPAPAADAGFGLLPFEVPGDGTVQGTNVSVSFCSVGVAAYGGQTPIRLNLDSSSIATSSTVELPTGGVAGALSGFVDLSGLTAGKSQSSDPTLCGSVVFSYGVPAVAASACVLDAGNCPTGCSFTYTCPAASQNGCCAPLATTYIYQAVSGGADAGNGCASAGQESLGSWSVTLTSASPVDAGYYGDGIYAPHGTLTAALVGTSGKSDTLNLSLSF